MKHNGRVPLQMAGHRCFWKAGAWAVEDGHTYFVEGECVAAV